MNALALRFWREGVIAALVVALIGMCAARDRRLEAKGAAIERSRGADSVLLAVNPLLELASIRVVHDTVRIRRTIARVDTLRETILERLSDTVIVREYIQRTDSAIAACTSLLADCASFRALSQTKIAALEAKLAVQPIAAPRSCTTSNLIVGALSFAGGILSQRVYPNR
jgi:hypothetical protein